MAKRVTKAHIKRERDPEKIERVLKRKGYQGGELPRGRVLHHIIPVSEGGKTTPKNTRVITNTKHKQIHANRKKRGLV